MLEFSKWEMIEALKKGLQDDFDLVKIVDSGCGEYKARIRYRMNILGEGELDGKYIPDLTDDNCEWDAYVLLKLRYGMSREEIDEWTKPQPKYLSPAEAKAEQWAYDLGFD
jgi:hypothetical protein